MQMEESGNKKPTLLVASIRFAALLALTVLIAIGLICWAFSCEHVVISSIRGPDDLEIKVTEERCMSATMQIKLYDKKWHREQDIFRYEPTGGNLPIIRWTKEGNIEIEEKNILYIDIQVIKIGNVNIYYKLYK